VRNALGVPPRHLTDSLPFSSSFELRPASFYTRLMPTPLPEPYLVCASASAAGLPPLFGGATNGINYTPYFLGGFPPGPPLNNPLNYLYGPSSRHARGAHHLLGDGAVRSISQNIHALTHDTLLARAGGKSFHERKAKAPL